MRVSWPAHDTGPRPARDGGLAPDPHGVITGGHGNSTGRKVAVYQDRPVDEDALREIFRAIIADNRAGGWRTIAKRGSLGG